MRGVLSERLWLYDMDDGMCVRMFARLMEAGVSLNVSESWDLSSSPGESFDNSGNRRSGDEGIPDSASFIRGFQEREAVSSVDPEESFGNSGNRRSGDEGMSDSASYIVRFQGREVDSNVDKPPKSFFALVFSTSLAAATPLALNTT